MDSTPVDTNSKLCPNWFFKVVCSSNSLSNVMISAAHFELHAARCARLNVLCNICGVKLLRTEQQNHMETVHAPVTCKCGETLDAMSLHHHEQEECPLRLIECKYCSVMVFVHNQPFHLAFQIPFKEMQSHSQYCGSRSEACKHCHRNIPIKGSLFIYLLFMHIR